MIVDKGEFYIYRHIRLDTNQPFYIGIGTKLYQSGDTFKGEYNRAHARQGRNNFWKNIVNKTDYSIQIVMEFDSYQEALNKEKELISLYGRRDINTGILCNLSDGGEIAPRGRKFKMSENQKILLSDLKSQEVFCYLLNGNYLKSFKNKEIAALELNYKKGAIAHAIHNSNLHKNHLFFTEFKGKQLPYTSDGKFNNINYKKAIIITKDNKILEFKSHTEAAKILKIDRNTIKRRMDFMGVVDLRIPKIVFPGSKLEIKIYIYDLNGNFIKEVKSLTEASKELNRGISALSIALKNSGKTNKHYIYREFKGNYYLAPKINKKIKERNKKGEFI